MLLFFFLFLFPSLVVQLIVLLSLLVLVAVISLRLHSLCCLYRLIDESTQSSMQLSSHHPSFLAHIVCLRHLWDVRPIASSSVFLFTCPFVEILPLPTSELSRVHDKEDNPSAYLFEGLSAMFFGLE